jgi:NAD(P)H-nitrite reductase large subunit
MGQPQTVDYLIIGGGAAGTTAAEAIRSRTKESLLIVTDDPNRFYSRVRLPDYIAGKVPRDKLFIKQETWYKTQAVDLLPDVSVAALSLKDRTVHLSNRLTIRYRKLLIAAGGVARRLRGEGFDREGIHYLRTLEDADRIREAIPGSKRAVVIGGGFIGLEMARCFSESGLETVMILLEPQFWPATLDAESNGMIEARLRERGIRVHYNTHVREIKGNGTVREAVLSNGARHDCDLVGIGIGITTSQPFVESSGLKTSKGLVTDEFLRTSDPDVYAAGDIAEFYDPHRAQLNQIGNWSNATEQGRTAAANLLGDKTPYRFVSHYVIGVFGLSVGFVGHTAMLPGTEVIGRGSEAEGSYVRLFLREGLLKGGTFINRPHEMRPVVELIRNRVPIERFRDSLKHLGFGLESIV